MAYMVKSSCWRCIWINFEFKRKESVWRQCSNKVGQSLTCAQPDWQWAWGRRRGEEKNSVARGVALVTLKVAAIAAKCTFWCSATLTRVQLHFLQIVPKSQLVKEISMGCNWELAPRSLHFHSAQSNSRSKLILLHSARFSSPSLENCKPVARAARERVPKSHSRISSLLPLTAVQRQNQAAKISRICLFLPLQHQGKTTLNILDLKWNVLSMWDKKISLLNQGCLIKV